MRANGKNVLMTPCASLNLVSAALVGPGGIVDYGGGETLAYYARPDLTVRGTMPIDGAQREVIGRHLCKQVTMASKTFGNAMPLLVHPKGAYSRRPLAQARAPNLLIASDYVRTHTDLASMESANEAARRAVRTIAYREGIDEDKWPTIYPLTEHALFAPGRAIDEVLFRLGLPHIMSPALRAIFGRPRSPNTVAESTGSRSLDAEQYLEILENLDEGVESWMPEVQDEGFLADAIGGLMNLATPILPGDRAKTVLATIRKWAAAHRKVFDGTALDAATEATTRYVIETWESLLRDRSTD